MCVLNVRFMSICTPRYLVEFTVEISELPNLYRSLGFLAKEIIAVFSKLSDSLLTSSQLDMLLPSAAISFVEPLFTRNCKFVSSAKRYGIAPGLLSIRRQSMV